MLQVSFYKRLHGLIVQPVNLFKENNKKMFCNLVYLNKTKIENMILKKI